MDILFITLMILLYTMQSLLCRKYSEHYPGEKNNASLVFTVVSGVIVALISLVMCGFSFSVTYPTILIAIVTALALSGYNFFLISASQTGSYSIVMVFSISGGIIIPTVVALLAFGDQISPIQLCAILMVLVSVYLISRKPGESLKSGKAFFFACTGLGICNGLYGTLLDVQQRVTGIGEKEEMVAIAYLAAAIMAFTLLLVKKPRGIGNAFRQTPRSLFYLLVCSVTVALAIHVLAYLLSILDNVVLLYTFDNAGVFCLSVICSCIFFREKLTKTNVCGCVLMCASLVAVSLG